MHLLPICFDLRVLGRAQRMNRVPDVVGERFGSRRGAASAQVGATRAGARPSRPGRVRSRWTSKIFEVVNSSPAETARRRVDRVMFQVADDDDVLVGCGTAERAVRSGRPGRVEVQLDEAAWPAAAR